MGNRAGKSKNILRIGLIGDPKSGKSSIISRFVHDKFSLQYKSQSENCAAARSFDLSDSLGPITIELWEIHSAPTFPIDIALILADSSLSISALERYYWKWQQTATSYGLNCVYLALSKTDLSENCKSDKYLNKLKQVLAMDEDQEIFLTSALLNKGIQSMIKTILEFN